MITHETYSDKYETNEDLKKTVNPDSQMKWWLIQYVGKNYQQELEKAKQETGKEIAWDGDVTVEMIVELMDKEFPEFLMAVAEENFIRGYRQAFIDTETGMALAQAEAQENEQS